MRPITRLMINEFKLKELGYDFMGYHLNTIEDLTFHHLLVPNRHGGPCSWWNGAILSASSSHPYIHLIEKLDYELFWEVTTEIAEMNQKGFLDMDNLFRINDLLCQFEDNHRKDRMKCGKLLIKEEYKRRVTN